MSDQFHEQISEFVDDEMSADESEFFVRRLQRDEQARHRYLRYQLIGAAVRGEYRHPGATDLGRRLEQAIERDEAEVGQSGPRWRRLASGTGIAASVALAVIFGFVVLGPEPPESGAADLSTWQSAPSLVPAETAVDPALLARAPEQVTGIQYMMHHARYSSGMFRTIAQSNVVATQETRVAASFVEPAVE
jgi:sigma-E factor negative regulatory protein RseA